MPGFIQEVCDTSYGYVDPYVQKTRNNVPLFDKAAHALEERVPPIIKQVDTLAEPTIEKIRPKVEPIIHKGVEMVTPYYEGGAHRVETAKELVTPYYEEGVKQVEDIRADVCQLYRVGKATNLQELKSVSKINKLLDKVDSVIDRLLPPPPNDVDTQSDDSSASDKSSIVPRLVTYPSTLLHRVVFHSKCLVPKKEDLTVANLKAQVVKAKTTAVKTVTTTYGSFKGRVTATYGSIKGRVTATYGSIKAGLLKRVAATYFKAKPFVEGKYEALNKTRIGKFAITTTCNYLKTANAICEKVLGKERVQACLDKVQSYVPTQQQLQAMPQKKQETPAQKKEAPPKKEKKDKVTDKRA